MKRKNKVHLCFVTQLSHFHYLIADWIESWLVDSEPYESKSNRFRKLATIPSPTHWSVVVFSSGANLPLRCAHWSVVALPPRLPADVLYLDVQQLSKPIWSVSVWFSRGLDGHEEECLLTLGSTSARWVAGAWSLWFSQGIFWLWVINTSKLDHACYSKAPPVSQSWHDNIASPCLPKTAKQALEPEYIKPWENTSLINLDVICVHFCCLVVCCRSLPQCRTLRPYSTSR